MSNGRLEGVATDGFRVQRGRSVEAAPVLHSLHRSSLGHVGPDPLAHKDVRWGHNAPIGVGQIPSPRNPLSPNRSLIIAITEYSLF